MLIHPEVAANVKQEKKELRGAARLLFIVVTVICKNSTLLDDTVV